MVALYFAILIAFIFTLSVVYENQNSRNELSFKSTGLWRWLTGADWPSKVGAALVIIGVGALLRYMMLFVQVPPIVKIASGGLISIVMGSASIALRNNPQRRAIHTALAGAALGTAYLTIFSAHNFFYLIPRQWAFIGLVVVCALGALYAVRSKAASIAVLSMFGAFMVPIFALNYTVPTTLIAYYLALATISWGIVRETEWRSLMHLSVIFVLLGGLPFMTEFNMVLPTALQNINANGILMILVLFLMVHLAMTLALANDKDDDTDKTWKQHLTTADIWVIGALTACLAFAYGVNRTECAVLFAVLSLVWAGAAFVGYYLRRKELPHYIAVTSLYIFTAAVTYFDDIPLLLCLQAIGVILLWQAPRLKMANDKQDGLSLLILMAALAYMTSASQGWNYNLSFGGQQLAYHLTASALLLWAAWMTKARNESLSSLLAWPAGVWAAFVIIHELIVWDLPPAVISMVGAILGACLVVLGQRRQQRLFWTIGMAFMAGAAIKMVFFDFGSLGQLANILAMIGTGLLFLGINWLAPYPPAAQVKPQPEPPSIKKSEAASAAASADPMAFHPITPNNQTTVGLWAIAASCLGAGLCLYWKMGLSGTEGLLALVWLLPLVVLAFFVSFGCIIASFIKNRGTQAAAAFLVWVAAFLLIFNL